MAKDPDFTSLEREISGVLYMSTAGEDFSEFAEKVPSVFYFVGAGNKEKNPATRIIARVLTLTRMQCQLELKCRFAAH